MAKWKCKKCGNTTKDKEQPSECFACGAGKENFVKLAD